MCNQTAGLVAAEIERVGIPTVTQVFLRDVAEKVRPPRALWVPFEHGYPLGEPNNEPLQREVLNQTFALLDRRGPGPVLVDYAHDPVLVGLASD